MSAENDVTLPHYFKLQYTAEDIAKRVKAMGESVSAWTSKVWAESHTDVVAVPVLRGGIFFFTDLVRSLKTSVEIAPLRTYGYESYENNIPRDSISIDGDLIPVKGRAVLLIDDICDSGRTFHVLKNELMKVGAREVRTAVLIKRLVAHNTFQPEWVGFEYIGPEWFVGYGMDDRDRWRNLGSIYLIQQNG